MSFAWLTQSINVYLRGPQRLVSDMMLRSSVLKRLASVIFTMMSVNGDVNAAVSAEKVVISVVEGINTCDTRVIAGEVHRLLMMLKFHF